MIKPFIYNYFVRYDVMADAGAGRLLPVNQVSIHIWSAGAPLTAENIDNLRKNYQVKHHTELVTIQNIVLLYREFSLIPYITAIRRKFIRIKL